MYLCRSQAGRVGKGEPFNCGFIWLLHRRKGFLFSQNIWELEHLTGHLNILQNIWRNICTFEHLNICTFDWTFEHLNIWLHIWTFDMWLDRRKGFLFSQNSATDPSHEDARLKYGESWRNSGYLCEFQPIYVLRNPIKSNPMLQQAGNGNRQFLAATM